MKSLLRAFLTLGSWLFSLACTVMILAVVTGLIFFNYYGRDLPDWRQLAQYNPPTVTRLYAADGRVLAEYATEKRVFVPLKAIPRRVTQAFISAEDKNFYTHRGIDISGIIRAIRDNIIHYGEGKSLVGGSTITQQVVKNFLLTNEKSIERKIREAILAIRISRVYSKERILELYLNEIYLGLGSYGVAAAAQNYFNKSLDELTVEDAALLAAQPKAPAAYDPRKNYDATKERRDWVIDRMLESRYLTPEEALAAKQQPITLHSRNAGEITHADFFAEEVRRWLTQAYGNDVLYQGGLVVKTTLDPALQEYADRALRKALMAYDRRHSGYRGALAHIEKNEEWKPRLAKLFKENVFHLFDEQKLAMVASVDDRRAVIYFEDESRGVIPIAIARWTGARKMSTILRAGDVVIVSPATPEQKHLLEAADQKKAWDLQQIPEVNGALIALDPHTGRVLAMSGGYAYGATEFNRATQARRQPGSAFKPFVYLAALENSFTPSTIIEDAPIELEQGPNLPLWQPQNYEGEYLGEGTLRQGLEKSRNTMTVRISQSIGIEKAVEISKRFGIYDDPPPNFSLVLGTSETTLLRLTAGYGMLANGGKWITPALVERIDDRHGQTIYRRDNRMCENCVLTALTDEDMSNPPPIPADIREQLSDPREVYQIISILEGVATRGTGARAREIGKIVAGKTGTTNDSYDAWFVGFTPDLVAGVYIGFDKPRTLGEKETGASTALPAFITFMKDALKNTPNKPFNIPRGIQLVRVDYHTGQPVAGDEAEGGLAITEAFLSDRAIDTPAPEEPSHDDNPENILTIVPETPAPSGGLY